LTKYSLKQIYTIKWDKPNEYLTKQVNKCLKHI
jgi:hypothetical protein